MRIFKVISKLHVVWIVSASILLFLIITIYFLLPELYKNPSRKSPGKLPGKLLIEGINLTSFNSDARIASIHIDSVQLTGKKNGFLRLNFIKVLQCNNITISVYPPASGRILAGENFAHAISSNSKESGGNNTVRETPPISKSLIKSIETLSGRQGLSVQGLEFHNFTLKVFHNQGTEFVLKGNFGETTSSGKKLILNGKVVAICYNRTLHAEKAIWDMSRGILEIPGRYTLEVNGNVRHGTGLTTDLKLNVITAG